MTNSYKLLNLYSFKYIFLILRNLPLRIKKNFFILFIVIILNGLSELVSIGSILPFLELLTNKDNFFDINFVKFFLKPFEFNNSNEALTIITLIFIVSIVLTAFFRLIGLWLNELIIASIGNNVSKVAFSNFLDKPYIYHMQENSNKLVTVISSQIDITVLSISAFLTLITSLILSTFILGGLLLISFKSALICFIAFVFSYLLIVRFSNKRLDNNSKIISKYSKFKFKNLQESIGSLRDIILYNSQNLFVSAHAEYDNKVRTTHAKNRFISNAPRYILEGLGIIIIIFFSLTFSSGSENQFSVLPILGAFALTAQKLLPCFQRIFSMWSTIISSGSSIKDVSDLLSEKFYKSVSFRKRNFVFKKSICLKNISFSYGEKNNDLSSINLTIKKGEKFGIIGKTGSGKSTLIDIIMGLLYPDSGALFVDELEINKYKGIKNNVAWQSKIALVPQNIFLADKTIYENIAFGIPKELISMDRVKKAAEKAQISDFIESTKDGYLTKVGERGIRLSGGELQRIGIARAFYKNVDILIFDEATNALDPATETSLLNEIFKINKNLTIIFVTHRYSTISRCSRFIKLERGKIVNEGNPKSLLKNNK